MATIKFLLQSKSISSPIYLRLSLGRGKSIKRKTGLIIDFKKWSSSSSLPKQNDENNKVLIQKLKKLETHILNEVNTAQSNGVDLNGDWLIFNINEFFNRNEVDELHYLIQYGEHFIEKLKNRTSRQGTRGVSIATKKNIELL